MSHIANKLHKLLVTLMFSLKVKVGYEQFATVTATAKNIFVAPSIGARPQVPKKTLINLIDIQRETFCYHITALVVIKKSQCNKFIKEKLEIFIHAQQLLATHYFRGGFQHRIHVEDNLYLAFWSMDNKSWAGDPLIHGRKISRNIVMINNIAP